MTTIYIKDPAAVLDYQFDWSEWLADGETITETTVVSSSEDLAVDETGESSGKVTAWLSGGEAGERYRVTCQITTDQGRTDERSILIDCQNR